jgi:hypothetical protein
VRLALAEFAFRDIR